MKTRAVSSGFRARILPTATATVMIRTYGVSPRHNFVPLARRVLSHFRKMETRRAPARVRAILGVYGEHRNNPGFPAAA